MRSACLPAAVLLGVAGGCADPATPGSRYGVPEDVWARLLELSPEELPAPPPDVTNRFADDAAAAALGHQLFFDPRFSGPLLDPSNNGAVGSLGAVGDTGAVSCSGCHIPDGFFDSRSPKTQLSLGAGWTRRRAPSLLDVGQERLLMWDGHRDTFFSQVFTPMEDALEFNSSRLFVAQQVARLYAPEYEAIFGPLPDLSAYEPLAPEDAGCPELPEDVAHGQCVKPGHDDPEVTRVVVDVGKAIQAYVRQLECGPSRFDEWVAGDEDALSEQEQAGALLFVGKAGCDACHSGPYLTDGRFHNVGLAPASGFFTPALEDDGASEGLAAVIDSPLNSRGAFSDGYDGRLDDVPDDLSGLVGAFRTPGLRCVGRQPSFLHTGQVRSLEDVVLFFDKGGAERGYPGVSENVPRGLTDLEREQLVAFLRALDGPGPDPALTQAPPLPPDPG